MNFQFKPDASEEFVPTTTNSFKFDISFSDFKPTEPNQSNDISGENSYNFTESL